jgi:hypothetical protein
MLKVVATSIALLSLVALGCGSESGPGAQEQSGEQASSAEALSSWCVPDGSFDDTLNQTHCCSGVAVQGSTSCFNPADYGTTWASCIQICGTTLVNGCVPSGGIDDVLNNTHCCSGAAVAGSTHCLNPTDYGTTWKTCVHTCQ